MPDVEAWMAATRKGDNPGVIPGRTRNGGEGNPDLLCREWIPFPVLRTAGDDTGVCAVCDCQRSSTFRPGALRGRA